MKWRELNKIVENVVWLALERGSKMVIGFFVGAWFARYLEPTAYGQYNYALSFVTIFGALTDLGIKRVLIRELVVNKIDRGKLLGTTALLLFFSGVLVSLMTTLSSWYIGDRTIFILVAIFSSTNLFAFMGVGVSFFEYRVESKYIVRINLIINFIVNIIRVTCILYEAKIECFAILFALENILNALSIFFLFLQKKDASLQLEIDWKVAHFLFRKSYPLLLSGAMIVIYVKVDQLMLAEMVNDKELGLYSVAVRLTEVWFFIPMIIQSSMFPNIASTKNNEDLYKKMSLLFRWLVGISFCIAIPITIFSDYIIDIIYGDNYLEASDMLRLLVWSIFFVSLGVARTSYLVTKGYLKEHLYFTTLGAIFNVGLNIVLIPKYGGEGAAIASVVSYAISGYLTSFLYPKMWKIGKIMTHSFLLK